MLVIDIARVLPHAREPDWLLSYELAVAWRERSDARPRVADVPGKLIATFDAGAPVSVTVVDAGGPGHSFRLEAGERTSIPVRPGQRIDVAPANVVRLDVRMSPTCRRPIPEHRESAARS